MKYSIEEHENQLDIHVGEVKEQKEALLQAFQECKEGRCSCPTDEYKKLDSLDVEQSEQGIKLHLKARDGEKIDSSEVNRCLEYTAKRLDESGKE